MLLEVVAKVRRQPRGQAGAGRLFVLVRTGQRNAGDDLVVERGADLGRVRGAAQPASQEEGTHVVGHVA